MQAVLERVKSANAERRQEREEKFSSLVATIADGREADPDSVIDILEATGKTDADLSAAVDLLIRRRAWAEQIKAEESARQTRAELQAKTEAADRELNAAYALHARKTGQIKIEVERLDRLDQASEAARRELSKTAPAHLRERQTELSTQREELSKKRADLLALARNAEGLARATRDRVDGSGSAASYAADAASLEARARQYRESISEIDNQLAALTEEGRKLGEVMLQP